MGGTGATRSPQRYKSLTISGKDGLVAISLEYSVASPSIEIWPNLIYNVVQMSEMIGRKDSRDRSAQIQPKFVSGARGSAVQC
jgi:hypothetical protein